MHLSPPALQAGEGKKARNCGPPPQGPPPFGAPPFGPHPCFFWVWPPTLWGPTLRGPTLCLGLAPTLRPHHDTKNVDQKNGLAKMGLAKVGFFRIRVIRSCPCCTPWDNIKFWWPQNRLAESEKVFAFHDDVYMVTSPVGVAYTAMQVFRHAGIQIRGSKPRN